jgi:putative DNA primase/helicase
MAKNHKVSSVSFKKDGVFIQYDDGEAQRVGDPIRVLAVGQGLQDKLTYTVLELMDRDKKWRKAVELASLLSAKTNDLKGRLADVHNYHLPAREYLSSVINALAAQNPRRRISVTVVPGWQGNCYAHPKEIIKPKGDDWECLFADNPNVHLADFRCSGTLDEWKKKVARHCCSSSRLRLAVGAPFAATILRRINYDSFGFHFVGPTSSGKTLSLRVASSVPGFNSKAGVTSWDGTPTGFEQLALGRRDNLLPLDETGLIAGDEKAAAKFVQLTTFRLSSNGLKIRAGHYTRRHVVDSDTRNIVLSSGEDVLPVEGQIRGQDVRLIQIPACASAFGDIFDSNDAATKIGHAVDQREKFVIGLEAATRQFQGVAQLEFLRLLVNDNDADNKLKVAVDEFSKSPIPQSPSRRVFARLRGRFAAVYAGMTLAIDYKILPFGKEAALRDLRKCMDDAMDLLIRAQGQNPAVMRQSDDVLIAQFGEHLRTAKFLKAGAHAKRKKSLTAEQIESADGFINYTKREKYRVMLQTHRLRDWYPNEATCNRLIKLLRTRKMFLAGRQADTCSRQVKFTPHPQKISVYWLSLKAFGLTKQDLQVC